jgi:methyltransferase (TIGR00027 family)
LAEAVGRGKGSGVRQCVILGAGLDTFACRNPFHEPRLRVFEVDHPATQAWKRQRLAEAEIAIPASLAFVPIDFATQSLGEGLASAGFDARQPAFFSMLGLVIFMPLATVMQILEFVAKCPSPSGVVLDYGIKQSALTAEQLKIRMAAARASASVGEPFLTFLDPAELAAQLKQLGFTKIDDFGCAEANARYLQNRADGLTVGTSGRRIVGASKMVDR